MKNLLKTSLLLAALYIAWLSIAQTDILPDDIEFPVRSEYGALLGGRR